jgi:hypothetical protein
MRTVFVNPLRRRRCKKSSNPRRRRRRNTAGLTRTFFNPRRSRRRNAGIVPFIQRNPLILENPRRRRRRNPSGFGGLFNFRSVGEKLLNYGGGSAIGTAANIFAINKIENMWMRNGLRVVAAILAPNLVRGDMGTAMAGSLLYPMWQEVALRFLTPASDTTTTTTATEADLDALSADLSDVLDEIASGQ